MNNAWATNGSPEMGDKKIERKKWRRGGGAEGKSGVWKKEGESIRVRRE